MTPEERAAELAEQKRAWAIHDQDMLKRGVTVAASLKLMRMMRFLQEQAEREFAESGREMLRPHRTAELQ